MYAVLIHSGGALGGHYYAYIKNMETGDWYNFNDSSVSPITVTELKSAYGGSGSAASSYQSSANAYMLLYRCVACQLDCCGTAAPGGRCKRDVILATCVCDPLCRRWEETRPERTLPPDDDVPAHVREAVERDAKEAERAEEALRVQRESITVGVAPHPAHVCRRACRAVIAVALVRVVCCDCS